jgi:hypothetical protein
MATVATRQEEKNLVQRKNKRTDLTPTGLLMEGDYTNNGGILTIDVAERHDNLKPIPQLLPVSILALMVACDPGMTIRQADPSAGSAANGGVTIHVRTSHPLIGEPSYAPEVEIANVSNSPINVTSVELVAKRGTFQNKPRRSGTYPVEVLPGKTEPLDVWFDLSDDVKKTFVEPAELRVHYRSGSTEQIAGAILVGGSLDTAAR